MGPDEEIGSGIFYVEVGVSDGSLGESSLSLVMSVRDDDLYRGEEGILWGEEGGESGIRTTGTPHISSWSIVDRN